MTAFSKYYEINVVVNKNHNQRSMKTCVDILDKGVFAIVGHGADITDDSITHLRDFYHLANALVILGLNLQYTLNGVRKGSNYAV